MHVLLYECVNVCVHACFHVCEFLVTTSLSHSEPAQSDSEVEAEHRAYLFQPLDYLVSHYTLPNWAALTVLR